MQRPNHLVDKSVLAEAVWGDHADQADNFHFVYAQMKNLRRKLIDAGANIEIKAIYGFGYKLSSANRIKSPSHETHIPYSFTFIFNFDSAHGTLGDSLLFYDGRRNQRRGR